MRRALGPALVVSVVASSLCGTAWATHYRYGRITWTVAGGNTIEFTIENSWRRSAYSNSNQRCRDVSLPSLPSKPCGGADGFPAVGDVIVEAQGSAGGTVFNPGQGSTIGSPLGPLLYLVTAIDPADDWLIGTALDPASLPAIDTSVTKTYTGPGTYTAFVATCCRVTASGGHINNASGNYRIETLVVVGSDNRSPVSSMPPIVQCPINGICTFTVPASDPDGDPIRFRLSTSTEASGSSGGFDQPGPPDAPHAASINSNTGLFTWNTTGATLSSPRTYYSAQVMIEDLTGVGGSVKSKIPVDFFIQLVSQAGTAPVFNHPPTPTCGSTLGVNPFDTLNFTVQASDTDALQSVTLNASGIPGGATMTPTLPVVGNPVSSSFSWTPTTAQAGQYVVTFTATDDALLQTLCSITIDVATCQTNADCDDGNACSDDVCDPGNPSANAGGCVYSATNCNDNNVCTDDSCDPGMGCINAPNIAPCSDGLFCTVGEHCSGGSCVGATPRNCGDSNPCTVDSCDEGAAQCVNDPAPLEGTACNDGLFCTNPDTCQSGVCGGPARDCSDHLSCTLDTCDEDANQCTNVLQSDCCGNGAVEGNEECDDGNPISGDGCEPNCTLSAACFVSHPGTPTERFVGSCGSPSFGTIQAAIAASQDGDIVSVCPGTYNQPILIDKEITLRSTGGAAATTLQASGVTVTIARSGVTIEGFTIESGTTAVSANSICPLGQASCSTPGARGSNITLADNVIRNSSVGVAWNGRVDCASIVDSTFSANGRHIELVQTTPPPAAVVVHVIGNRLSGGGTSGSAVSLGGMVVTFAANTLEGSAASGLHVDNAPGGLQVLENEIRQNAGDGIRIGPGGVATRVLNNNITNNGVGLGNEGSGGVLDATLNWWRSQTGPSGVFTGVGDSIVNRSGATTAFIEFLCRPFPQGFPSLEGVCGIETPELRLLGEGSNPDVDPVGGYITFESRADLDRDPRTAFDNSDGSQEVFLLSRKTLRKLGGVCLGGVNAGAVCKINLDCPGDLGADPLVLNGDCILMTQVTDDPSPDALFSLPRLTARGRAVVFGSALDPVGRNGDGSREVFRWDRKAFGKGSPEATRQLSQAEADTQRGAPGLSGRRVLVESEADLAGQNADGNWEIFLLDVKAGAWTQVTVSSGADSRRPAVGSSGRHIVFDSTGDLNNDPDGFSNPDGNREIFLARLTSKGIRIRQLTDTQPPVDNRAGGGLGQIRKVAVFSSNGDLVAGENTDGNREVFLWNDGQIKQLTRSTAGLCESGCGGDPDCLLGCGNLNPVVDRFGRRVAFESTANLDNDGATNRRVYLYENKTDSLLRLSRSRFGENRVPRISNGRFVVWESTADLTGGNPEHKRVIYLFDRRKDE